MATLYWEDFSAGQSFELGSRTLDRDDIVAFAREYDPQPFHVDEAAARRSIYGGLIASGWQTGSIYMRLLYDGLISRTAGLGSPGLDELRWLAPVRPGDTLTARLFIDGVRTSNSRPDRGFIMTRGEVANQHSETVLSLKAAMMIRRRHAAT
jgi:acyl dehydratase